jgi:peptide/nickel transport system substrate-binding protein
VIFTIETAQNPDYGSSQRISWQGVEVEKIDDYALMFKLKNKYAQFLNNFTLGIIPKHLWQDVKPISFSLSELNLKPIGSGPYVFDKFRKDRLGRIISYELKANDAYYGGQPNIDRIELKFYASEDELIDAYNRNEVESLSVISAQNIKRLKYKNRISIKQIKLPRYFGLFFNQNKSAALANKNVRLALSYGTDKPALLRDILDGNGVIVDSPMIGGILDINSAVKKYDFNQEEARKVLATDGWKIPEGGTVLEKGKNKLYKRNPAEKL